jgi:Amt family ammonium transporter
VEDILNLRYALDTFYFLVMGAFVMWMAAGFSMLEAGLVRAKNTTEILTKNVALYAIACVMYMLVGYNLMYPGDAAVNSIWPGLSFLLGTENDPAAVLSASGESWYDGAYYSGRSDFFFQVVFVATAMSIVSGAVAERMKLWPFLAFCVVLTGFIYPIQGFWKWGGGFLDGMGFSDFAGSGVVHLTGATAALAGVWMVGARKGKYSKDGKVQALPGANLPLATLGTFILWLGWFGFNGGSELVISNVGEANAVAAAAGGVVAALLAAKIILGRADLTMVLNGALAGLVAITAEPLAPSPLAATLIGAVGGAIVVLSVLGLDRLRIDDPVGAISVHGVVGIWGLLAVPITNSDASLITQLIGAAVIFGFVMIASLIAWGTIKAVAGLRVSEEEEYRGVDVSECGLEAYPEFTSGPK